MDFSQLIRERYSVRAYRPDEVEEEKLAQVLEAARMAPTADNRQPFRLIVVKTAGRERELKRIYPADWLVQAPLVILACGIPQKSWRRSDGRSYLDIDVGIVMDHLVMAATDLGLGTCWVAAFNAGAAREVLGLPAEAEPIVLTPLGYPAVVPSAKKRKPLTELVSYDKW